MSEFSRQLYAAIHDAIRYVQVTSAIAQLLSGMSIRIASKIYPEHILAEAVVYITSRTS